MAETHKTKPVKRVYLDGQLIHEYYDVLNRNNWGEYQIEFNEYSKSAFLKYNNQEYKGAVWIGYDKGIETWYFSTGKKGV
jgi:hypothetical protein